MNFETSYTRLPPEMYSSVTLDTVDHPELLAWNETLAADLGLDGFANDRQEIARVFSGGPLPDDVSPVAFAYAGHQFGMFVPQLGDGRAALLGEVVDRQGGRYDIQLKGSGRTPFSRGGDGRSWLGPVIREYLVSEAMHRLGVPTTRALAAVATGEPVYRDGMLPGAVFTRVAGSHLRVGTFEYLAAKQQSDALRALTDYAIDRHYPDVRDADDPYAAFFDAVASRQAQLVAKWMAVGFIHGVMNTDNTSIAGETIDYGPCAFMDEFKFDKVFSSIDRHGRYAYGNQPAIAQWNLARLADCLLGISESRDAFEATLADFPERYHQAHRQEMRPKLGLETERSDDAELINAWLLYLDKHALDYTLSFRDLATRITAEDTERFGEIETYWRRRLEAEQRSSADIAAGMNAVNPLFIPRNHRIEEAIQHAVDGDLSVFEDLETVLADPFDDHADRSRYAEAPKLHERVKQTFCGT